MPTEFDQRLSLTAAPFCLTAGVAAELVVSTGPILGPFSLRQQCRGLPHEVTPSNPRSGLCDADVLCREKAHSGGRSAKRI